MTEEMKNNLISWGFYLTEESYEFPIPSIPYCYLVVYPGVASNCWTFYDKEENRNAILPARHTPKTYSAFCSLLDNLKDLVKK